MRNRGRRRTLALALTALAGGAGGVLAQGAEPAALVLILDGSGSMWANLEGVKGQKLATARDAIRRGLARIGPHTRVGLASFGHRRGDCSDVEVIRKPEPVDLPRYMEPLEKLNPRGRGPVTQALREAAKALPAGPGRRSLILIHDDADNCQPNVCVAAQELRGAGVVVHVVGLALKPDDAAKMACLPQATGGRLVNAQTAEQAGMAIEDAIRLAGDPRPNVLAAQPRPPPAAGVTAAVGSIAPPGAAAVPQPPADAPPGLYLRARLAAAAQPINLALDWTVVSEGQPATVVFSGRAASPYVPVPPGRYLVEARDGPVAASTAVSALDKGPTVADLVLEAGTLRVGVQAQKSGAAIAGAIVTISNAGPEGGAGKPAGPPLLTLRGGDGSALLPAGRYAVRAEHGLTRAERMVIVPAGSQGHLDIALNAALLQLSAVGKEVAESADALVFSIAEDDSNSPTGRREVARSAARQAEFALPPGTYYVTARLGIIEARDSVAVGAGDVVKRTLSVAPGKLMLATKPLAGAQLAGEAITYRVERIDSADAVTTSRPSPVLLLPGGRYRVEGRYGPVNVRAEQEVEVKSGQTVELTLEHRAASLKLRLMGSGGLQLGEVFWDVRNEAGAMVWTTGQPEPSALLQAGRYRVRAETRDKHYERDVELRAGEARLLELTAD